MGFGVLRAQGSLPSHDEKRRACLQHRYLRLLSKRTAGSCGTRPPPAPGGRDGEITSTGLVFQAAEPRCLSDETSAVKAEAGS